MWVQQDKDGVYHIRHATIKEIVRELHTRMIYNEDKEPDYIIKDLVKRENPEINLPAQEKGGTNDTGSLSRSQRCAPSVTDTEVEKDK